MIELKGKYTNAVVYTDTIENEAISQIIGLCNHPAFADAAIRVMPDAHAGSGCTIGTTVKTKNRCVIPNIVGVDIGCGVLTTIFQVKNPIDFKLLDEFIASCIPSGMEIRKTMHPSLKKEIQDIVKEITEDLNINNLAYHINSVGTLGRGNHYIEIGVVDDKTYALSVHTGSRNLGKKVCEIFQQRAIDNLSGNKELAKAQKELIMNLKKEHREVEINKKLVELKRSFHGNVYGIPKDLAFIEGSDFDDYVVNMLKCQKIAAVNRHLISFDIINFIAMNFSGTKVIESFDTVHNYIEQKDDCIIIRKGAISAKNGEKLAIPLNMKDGVIIGVGLGNKEWNESAPHGAGRLLSRSKAKEKVSLEEYQESMKGIQTWSVNKYTLDESPQAYKPMESIIDNIKETVKIQSVVKPVYNFKAHAPEKTWAEIKKELKNLKR